MRTILWRLPAPEGWNYPYRDRPDCQLFQLAFLTCAGNLPEDYNQSDIWWYCINFLDFCFSAEMFRKLIIPLLDQWEKRADKIVGLLSHPILKEQFALYSLEPHKTFQEAMKEHWSLS